VETKRVVQLAVVVGSGLPAAVFESVRILDHIRGGSTFDSTVARQLLGLMEFFAGFGSPIFIPIMWITFGFVVSSLSHPSKFALAAFALLSTLGALDFWF
jgi:hypothetical protein